MQKPRVVRPRVHDIDHRKLTDMLEALEHLGVNNRSLKGGDMNVTMNRIPNDTGHCEKRARLVLVERI